MKQLFIAGNWKMHYTRSEAEAIAKEMVEQAKGSSNKLMIAVPFTLLETVGRIFKSSNIALGAQNVAWAEKGAFTGEISAGQLKDLGVEYVLVGHSERRQYFGETDKTVNDRTKAGLNAGIKVVLCVGETLGEREAGKLKEVVETQIKGGLTGITADQMANITIAYEPVWAIGTGVVATPDQAEDAHKLVREYIASLYSQAVADALFIQYGGSVKGDNVVELMSKPNINGALVGGASLKAGDFSAIMNASV